MDLIQTLVDFFLHLDEELALIISNYGAWTYAILFLVIFMETGFVVTPFLPGDSLLFAASSWQMSPQEILIPKPEGKLCRF